MNDELQDFIAKRIHGLRTISNLSARDLSISLGHNASYINKIENKQAKPSLDGLYYICHYFQISLHDFFNTEIVHTSLVALLLKQVQKFDEESLLLLIELTQKMASTK